MPPLTLMLVFCLGSLALIVHLLAVALSQALRTYSRSRLEERCARQGRPARADEIVRLDEPTERATEFVAVVSGLGLAALAGAVLASSQAGWTIDSLVLFILLLGITGHLIASVVGRVYAESIIDAAWPTASLMRTLVWPWTQLTRAVEALVERRAHGRAVHTPRPPSVEVEIHTSSPGDAHEIEAELTESTRLILERAVSLASRDVASLMTPRSSIVALPATTALREAATVFAKSGLSRIPLYGEHRDDIVGMLYVKDLIPYLFQQSDEPLPSARKLARPALFVPETKIASELLEEFRTRRVQLAIVLDEFGSVTGLVSLEDLLEAIVGPIDDEHDAPGNRESVIDLGDGQYVVDASMPLEVLNERLELSLPTHGDYQTVGGLAFDTLGRVPEPGTTFRADGAEFLVLEVSDHAIRKLRVHIRPAAQSVAVGDRRD